MTELEKKGNSEKGEWFYLAVPLVITLILRDIFDKWIYEWVVTSILFLTVVNIIYFYNRFRKKNNNCLGSRGWFLTNLFALAFICGSYAIVFINRKLVGFLNPYLPEMAIKIALYILSISAILYFLVSTIAFLEKPSRK